MTTIWPPGAGGQPCRPAQRHRRQVVRGRPPLGTRKPTTPHVWPTPSGPTTTPGTTWRSDGQGHGGRRRPPGESHAAREACALGDLLLWPGLRHVRLHSSGVGTGV